MPWKIVAVVAAVLALLVLATAARFAALARSSRLKAPELGLVGGRLRPCPASPNCVSSEDGTDAPRRVDALPVGRTLDETRAALRAAIAARAAEEGCPASVVADEATYLRAEFRSRLFGFVDDLELRVDMPAGVVHVRSASRTGHSDFGVNKKRIDAVRRAYLEASRGPGPQIPVVR